MKRIQLIAILACIILMGGTAKAQEYLSLQQAIANALKSNYNVLLSKNDSVVAAIDYSYRNAALLPRLNATLGKNWNNNNVTQTLADGSKRGGSGIRSTNLTGQLSLNWTLYDGMRMFIARDKIDRFMQLGELTIKEQLVATIAAVMNAYYAIVQQKQQLKAIEEQIDITQERVKLAQAKLDIGVGTRPDLLQSKVDLNAFKAAQLAQQTLIAQQMETLAQLVGQKPGTLFQVGDSIPVNMNLVQGDIVNGLDNSNPSLLLAKKNMDIATLTLKEKKAERYPVISFNANYNYNRTVNKKVINNFSTLFNRNNGYNYGFTAAIPIFNNYSVKRQIQQLQQDISFSQLAYNNQRSLLELEIARAFKDYEWQKKALLLEEESILLAQENAAIVLQSYKLGGSTVLQLKEAQKGLEDARRRLITARYNAKLAEIALLRAKGDLLQ
jgi:outer membrane protein